MIRCVMDAAEAPRDRLRRLVAARRRERQLSVSAAAKAAGIARGTWIALEDGSRETEAYNYAGIERALGWVFGSIDAILAGVDPTPVTTEEAPTEPPPRSWQDTLERVRQIAENPDRSPGLRAIARAQVAQIEALLDAARVEEEGQSKRAS